MPLIDTQRIIAEAYEFMPFAITLRQLPVFDRYASSLNSNAAIELLCRCDGALLEHSPGSIYSRGPGFLHHVPRITTFAAALDVQRFGEIAWPVFHAFLIRRCIVPGAGRTHIALRSHRRN